MSSTNKQGSKTPGEMLKVGALVFIVPIVVIIFLINMNLGNGGTNKESMAPEMVLSRIAPVAHYNTGAPLAQPKADGPLTGEQVYNKLCMTCHDAGLSDSPIKGNTEMWAPRIAQGADILFKHSLEGFNAMPAKGGDMTLSDDEVKGAVVFMVNASGGNISLDSGGAAAPAAEEEAPAAEETATTEATGAVENAVENAEDSADVAVEAATEAAETAATKIEETITEAVDAVETAVEDTAATVEEAAAEAVQAEEVVTEEAPLNQQVPEHDSAAGTVSPTQAQDPANPTEN